MKKIDREFLTHPLTISIIIIRTLAALLMFVSPLWGYIWTVVWDYLDAPLLLYVVKVSRKQYHYLDKNLDFVYFTVMLIIGFSTYAASVLVLLFLFRLIGHYLFMRTHRLVFFVLFPNFFEVLFVWSVLGLEHMLYWQWLIVLFLLKEVHEIGLHYVWANYLTRRGITGTFPIRWH